MSTCLRHLVLDGDSGGLRGQWAAHRRVSQHHHVGGAPTSTQEGLPGKWWSPVHFISLVTLVSIIAPRLVDTWQAFSVEALVERVASLLKQVTCPRTLIGEGALLLNAPRVINSYLGPHAGAPCNVRLLRCLKIHRSDVCSASRVWCLQW